MQAKMLMGSKLHRVTQVSKITVKNSKMKRQNQRKSRHLLKVLIWLLTTAMFQWGCGQIPEEGTIVYDVDFPPADRDEAQSGGSGGGSGGSTPQNIILNASKTTLNELGSDTLTISATSGATSTTNIIVSVGYSGTATRGSDYSSSADNLTILAGSTTSNSITITSRDDGIYDDGETIDVDISSVSGGDSAVESGTQQKTIVFSDDELPPAVTPPVVSISASADSITEDSGGTITITVEQDVVASIATTVTLTLTGTATNTTDYHLSSTTATIAAGTLQDNLILTPTTDSITEDNETVLISIASVSGGDNASEDGVQIAEVTITDDEPLRTVTLGFDTTSVNENAGSGAITITATQSGQAQADTIVNLGVSGDALASGTDYTLNSSFITIAGGTTTGTTTIDIVNDVIDEGDNETFALEISSVTGGNGASESGTQSVTAMILDNDVAGFTQVGPTDPVGVYYSNPLYLNEGDNETFTIVLNTQPQGTVYFDITGSGGGACGSDAYYDCYALADGSQILTFDEDYNITNVIELPDNKTFEVANVLGVASGDINADGLNDLIFTMASENYRYGSLQVLLQTESTEFEDVSDDWFVFEPYSDYWTKTASLMDIDGDADLDLILGQTEANDLHYYENIENKSFDLRVIADPLSGWGRFHVGIDEENLNFFLVNNTTDGDLIIGEGSFA